MEAQTHGSGEGMELIELGVVVVMKNHDPRLLNPDYLRNNEIVGPGFSADADMFVSPLLSHVTFSGAGSLFIMGDADRLTVKHGGLGVSADDMASARIAETYLQKRETLHCTAVGINPKVFMAVEDPDNRKISNLLAPNLAWTKYKDAVSDVRLGVRYRFPDKSVTLSLNSTVDKDGRRGIVFEGNIHRDIAQSNSREQTQKTMAVLRSWREDLSDFDSLVRLFDFKKPGP